MLMNSIARGFKKLRDFQGRDRRSEFWPYTGVIMAVSMVLMTVAIVPAMLQQFDQTLAFAEANPDQASVYRSATNVHVVIHDPAGMPPMDYSGMLVPLAIMLVVVALLLSAAVTRRLHDRGLSGRWALIPLALYGVGIVFWMRMLASMLTDATGDPSFMITFMLNFLVLMLGQLSLFALVIVLALKGKTGPNRYGPEPV